MHQVYLERVKNSVSNKCLKTLTEAEKIISKELKKTNGVYTKKRYKEILSVLKSVSNSLKENLSKNFDLDELITTELERQQKILASSDLISVIVPTVEKVKSAILFTPILENKTFQSFLESISTQFYDVWDSHVRTGYLTGMTTSQIVSSVLGSVPKGAQVAKIGAISSLRKSLMLNSQTALASFAENTRASFYDANKELFAGYKFVATLDRKTCLVCGSLDGVVKKNREDFPSLPMHFNCRCLTIPILKTDIVQVDDERESEFGPVSSKITYEEWLKSQSPSVQRDVLGEGKYQMYVNGTKFSSFVSDNRELTLEQLKKL